jgi:8-oxo-dGTP pyrophosphatase MutT (NUDIX family)
MTASLPGHNLFRVPEVVAFRDAVVAIIVLDDGRYLMQLRDDKPGIFYPNHWGLFGGAVDCGEQPEAALRRELMEELQLETGALTYFTRMDFDFSRLNAGSVYRIYYELRLPAAKLSNLRLGEGRLMEALDLRQILLDKQVVPYDSFALWLHYAESTGKSDTTNSTVSRLGV